MRRSIQEVAPMILITMVIAIPAFVDYKMNGEILESVGILMFTILSIITTLFLAKLIIEKIGGIIGVTIMVSMLILLIQRESITIEQVIIISSMIMVSMMAKYMSLKVK